MKGECVHEKTSEVAIGEAFITGGKVYFKAEGGIVHIPSGNKVAIAEDHLVFNIGRIQGVKTKKGKAQEVENETD